METTACILFCKENDPEKLKLCIDQALSHGVESLAILACDADRWVPQQINPILQRLSVPVFGGIFPSIIHENQRKDRGTLIAGFSRKVESVTIQNLSTRDETMDQVVREQCASMATAKGLITFVDGLGKNIEQFVESLYSLIGIGPNVVGCGAGSLDFVQKPCLFTNAGLLEDAGIVIQLPFTLHRGVNHGWQILDGPFLVTGSNGQILETLNYRPAFEIYRERVEEASGLRFENNDFFSIAKTYPFGIERLDGDILVRDPIRIEQDALVCVGNIPENATVYILKGNASELIASAEKAATEARSSYSENGSNEIPSALVFDCISRVLFLDNDFDQELSAIQGGLGKYRHAFGALTLGEITNTRNGPINFLNKSTVVGVF